MTTITPTAAAERLAVSRRGEHHHVRVRRTIAADAGVLYDLVADIERMGEWSPETVDATWLGTARGEGARFSANNRLGILRWGTECVVLEADPGRSFAFFVEGISQSTWRYDFVPSADGTVVTEEMRQDRRQPLAIRVLQRTAGVTDRAAHLADGMATTLDRLAAAAA